MAPLTADQLRVTDVPVTKDLLAGVALAAHPGTGGGVGVGPPPSFLLQD